MDEQKSKEMMITDTKKEIIDLETNIKKNYMIADYLNYIQLSMKDENIKQHAISSFMPFINKQTNHYLSETGHKYYVMIDKWMDIVINGIGVADCGFKSMSGGEGKSIDLALKFAITDITRMQAGNYLDLMILDEFLDSSIDSIGIASMVKIIKQKQRDDDLKVCVVSHRQELDDYDFDNTYLIENVDGYSKLKKVY